MQDSEPVQPRFEDGHAPVSDLEAGLEDAVVEALENHDAALVRKLMAPAHYADVADLLERLNTENRGRLLDILGPDFEPDTLTELDDAVRDDVIEHLGVEAAAAAVQELDSDDALQVMEELNEDDQQQLLDAMPDSERSVIEQGLSYPEDSAGRLMQREVVFIPTFWNVGETIDYIRKCADSDDNNLPDHFHDIFIVDPAHKPVGMLALDQLLRTRRPVKIVDIMDDDITPIPVNTDQEDVALLFRRRDLTSAPVVDATGRLLGTITIDDVVDVIDEEHEQDIMRLGGVQEGDLYDAVLDTTRARFSWLLVNLGTAIIASLVIGLFDATLEQIIALAILMPVVASMGGNAGTQTMTVTVRALAMKELTTTNALRVVGKEILVGAINGVLFAVIAALVVWLWFDSLTLGLVIGLAMIVNMVVAGFSGTMIPMLLDHLGFDPAVASSVFLTTVTDVVGFFVFLGLAALIML